MRNISSPLHSSFMYMVYSVYMNSRLAELGSEDGKMIQDVESVNAAGEIRKIDINARSGTLLCAGFDDHHRHETCASHKNSGKS
jgi:hypothetical protein